MRHVVIDYHTDVVDVYSARYDISCYKDVFLSALKEIHHLITFLLGEVAVHGAAVDLHPVKLTVDVLHSFFLAREYDNTLMLLCLEDMAQYAQFLSIVTHVSRLPDFFSRLAHRNLYFYGVVENISCKSLYLVGHSG